MTSLLTRDMERDVAMVLFKNTQNNRLADSPMFRRKWYSLDEPHVRSHSLYYHTASATSYEKLPSATAVRCYDI